MKILWAFVRTSFLDASIYRLDFWVSLLSVFITMYANFSIWHILYQQSPNAFGMDLQRMTTYGVLGMLLVPILSSSIATQHYIAQQVRSGSLDVDLMKPLDFIFHMLGRNIGAFLVQIVTRGIPGLLFAFSFLGFRLPGSWEHGLAFLCSLVLGYLVFFATNFLMGMLAIVTLDIRSYGWAYNSLIRFASGQMIPLWMFPPFLAAVAAILPFRAVYFVPMSIYIGAYDGSIATALLEQTAWVVGLFGMSRFVWSRAYRRITIQGG